MRFRLNHSDTRDDTNDIDYSLWVGNVTQDVDDFVLNKMFGTRDNIIKTAKVIHGPNGISKVFEFDRFHHQEEYGSALTHMICPYPSVYQ